MAQKNRLRVVKMFPVRTGVSKGKEWQIKEVLTLTYGKWPKELFILITAKKDVAIAERYLQEGDIIQTELRPESREYNGKYYTTMRTYGLQILDENMRPKFNKERTGDEAVSDEDYEDIDVAF